MISFYFINIFHTFELKYSHLSNKQAGWNKRAGGVEFFVYSMKKCEQGVQVFRFLHKNASRGAKNQKSKSKAARL